MSDFELVIGLEVHAQLRTRSKLFCGCEVRFGAPPNTLVCPVCLGLPGALPVVNERAFELAVQTGVALGCEIAAQTKFDRKSYFYPDLPKNYQISQYDRPFASGGRVTIDLEGGATKEVPLERIHLEEDAGKMIHGDKGESQVDCNRTGIPLLEIVTRPELASPAEAGEFIRELKQILEYLGVSDCNMEEGSLRCDCNVSVRPPGQTALGTKTEIKNLNSIKAIERALEYEGRRQGEVLTAGQEVESLTMLWREEAGRTEPMRAKEAVHDYRYFPDPDLGPLQVSREFVAARREALVELPRARRERFVRQYGVPADDARRLTQTRALADYFEAAVAACHEAEAQSVAHWMVRDVLAWLNETQTELPDYPVSPAGLAELADLLAAGRLNQTMGRELLREMVRQRKPAAELALALGERISGEEEIELLCRQALRESPEAGENWQRGKKNALKFLVGQVMKASKGKADAKKAEQILEAILRGDGPA